MWHALSGTCLPYHCYSILKQSSNNVLAIPGGFSIKHGVGVNDNDGIGAAARTNRNNIMGVELHDTIHLMKLTKGGI